MHSTSETKSSDKSDHYKKFCDSLAPIPPHDPGFLPTSILDEKKLAQDAKFYFEHSPLIASQETMKPSDIYTNNFIVAEYHSDISPKKFLIEHMKELKTAGFGILFMEHLFYDDQQLLDDYYSTGIMSDKLRKNLEYMNWGFGNSNGWGPNGEETLLAWGKYNFLTLIEAAYIAGIRVVGLDIESVYRAAENYNPNRILYMNYTANKIIEREMNIHKDCKWAALMGVLHTKTVNNIQGIADTTGARTIQIFDVDDELPSIKLNVANSLEVRQEHAFSKEVKTINVPADIIVRSRFNESPTGFVLFSDMRKAKLEEILAKLHAQPFVLHGGGKPIKDKDGKEIKRFPKGVATVVELIKEIINKGDITVDVYKTALQQIYEHLHDKAKPKSGIFGLGKRDPSTIQFYQQILIMIESDMQDKSLAFKLEFKSNKKS